MQDQQGPDGHEYGGVYKSTDGGESWTRVNSVNPRPMYFSVVRVDPNDDQLVYVLGIALYRSSDGGKTFKGDAGNGVHADQHALWIDPHDGRHMLVGSDGGFYVTYDRADNWDHLNHLALGQFYHVAVDTKRPYWVYGGLQDNGTWGGPSIGLPAARADQRGLGLRLRRRRLRLPRRSDRSRTSSTSRRRTAAWAGAISRPARAGAIRPGGPGGQDGRRYRFNWNTPFILSHHNPKIFYCGGEFVFRSVKRGDDLKIISPEITRTKRGSATALAESPKNPDVLWAGTDDGNLWVTRDGGKKWTNVADKVGLPGPRWVATIEASRFQERGPGLRLLRRPSLRRRQAVPLRHRGFRPDLEEHHEQPAGGRLDALPARGRRESRPALLRHRVHAVRVDRTAARRGRRSTTTCRRSRSTKSPCIRRPARSSPRRMAAACGCST